MYFNLERFAVRNLRAHERDLQLDLKAGTWRKWPRSVRRGESLLWNSSA